MLFWYFVSCFFSVTSFCFCYLLFTSLLIFVVCFSSLSFFICCLWCVICYYLLFGVFFICYLIFAIHYFIFVVCRLLLVICLFVCLFFGGDGGVEHGIVGISTLILRPQTLGVGVPALCILFTVGRISFKGVLSIW